MFIKKKNKIMVNVNAHDDKNEKIVPICKFGIYCHNAKNMVLMKMLTYIKKQN